MITTYLLEGCKNCKGISQYIQNNPNRNVSSITVSKEDVPFMKKNDNRFGKFPVSVTGSIKNNGLPYKNAKFTVGSSIILRQLKNLFGSHKKKLTGTSLNIDYLNDNEGNIQNIREYTKNCFGKSCHVMDQPYGPQDNLFILQGYQSNNAAPIRSHLPIRNVCKNDFGITPGTKEWASQRRGMESYKPEKMLLCDDSLNQSRNYNKYAKINYPRQFSNNKLNARFGNSKTVSTPFKDNYSYLTYAAGGNGVSRVTGQNFYNQQNPIGIQNPPSSYINGNLKKYVNNSNSQNLLKGGLDSKWSINAQGINPKNNSCFGRENIDYIEQSPYPGFNPWILTPTAFNSSQGASGTAQYFKRDRFPNNGNAGILQSTNINTFPYNSNAYGKVKTNKSKINKEKRTKYTSPLGIEITF